MRGEYDLNAAIGGFLCKPHDFFVHAYVEAILGLFNDDQRRLFRCEHERVADGYEARRNAGIRNALHERIERLLFISRKPFQQKPQIRTVWHQDVMLISLFVMPEPDWVEVEVPPLAQVSSEQVAAAVSLSAWTVAHASTARAGVYQVVGALCTYSVVFLVKVKRLGTSGFERDESGAIFASRKREPLG